MMMGLVFVAILASCCASNPFTDRLDNTRARARSLATCFEPAHNCRVGGKAGACCDAGKTCFEKLKHYGQCKDSCPKNADWACYKCFETAHNCRVGGKAGACCDAGKTCFEKLKHYGQCKDSCPENADWACYKASAATTKPEADTSDAPCPFLGKGINLGNRLEWQIKWGLKTKPSAPSANPTFFAQEMWTSNRHDAHVFKEYKKKGFEWVRIPVSYNEHTALDPPYTIRAIWLASVRRHVQYALDNNLKVKINVHHENKKLSASDKAKCSSHETFKCRYPWMDVGSNKDVQNLPRLVSIWTQIATEFKDVDPNKLVFEVFNEPHNFVTIAPLNAVMRESLKAIRNTGGNNAKRLVYIAGMRFSNPDWYTATGGNVASGNPAKLQAKDFVVPAGDANLGLAVHSYDPFNVCGGGTAAPSQSARAWGKQRYQDALRVFKAAKDWATAHGIKHVALGECGCSQNQKTTGIREAYYEYTSKAAVDAGLSYAVWDDNGKFPLLKFQDFDSKGQWDDAVVNKLADFACTYTTTTDATTTTTTVTTTTDDITIVTEDNPPAEAEAFTEDITTITAKDDTYTTTTTTSTTDKPSADVEAFASATDATATLTDTWLAGLGFGVLLLHVI